MKASKLCEARVHANPRCQVASRILSEAVEAFAEGFVINFLPEREQPLRRLRFGRGSGCHFPLFVRMRIVVLFVLISGVWRLPQ